MPTIVDSTGDDLTFSPCEFFQTVYVILVTVLITLVNLSRKLMWLCNSNSKVSVFADHLFKLQLKCLVLIWDLWWWHVCDTQSVHSLRLDCSCCSSWNNSLLIGQHLFAVDMKERLQIRWYVIISFLILYLNIVISLWYLSIQIHNWSIDKININCCPCILVYIFHIRNRVWCILKDQLFCA